MILPMIEQSSLYNSINQSLTIFGYENRTVMPVLVGSFTCPSDWASKMSGYGDTHWLAEYGLATESERLPMAFSSYSGCFGSYFVNAIPRLSMGCVVPSALSARANGTIGDASPISAASVRDGLSNTMLVTEKAVTFFQRSDSNGSEISAEYGWYFSGNWGDTLTTGSILRNAPRKLPKAAGDAVLFAASSLHSDRSQCTFSRWFGSFCQGLSAIMAFRHIYRYPSRSKTGFHGMGELPATGHLASSIYTRRPGVNREL